MRIRMPTEMYQSVCMYSHTDGCTAARWIACAYESHPDAAPAHGRTRGGGSVVVSCSVSAPPAVVRAAVRMELEARAGEWPYRHTRQALDTIIRNERRAGRHIDYPAAEQIMDRKISERQDLLRFDTEEKQAAKTQQPRARRISYREILDRWISEEAARIREGRSK